MKEKPVDANLPPHVKSSLWVARHYKHILFFSLGISALVLLFSSLVLFYAIHSLAVKDRVINNMANKVIFLRMDGSVGILDKQPITQSPFHLYLRHFVSFYLLLSGFDFDANPDISKSEKFKVVLAHLDENGARGYRAYVERLYMSYKNNNLPEEVRLASFEGAVEDFRYQDGKFTYYVSFPVEVRYVYAEKFNVGRGNVEVFLRGYQTPARSSVLNPLGVVITQLEVRRYVSKTGGVDAAE